MKDIQKHKLGDVVAVTFLDHVEDSHEPMKFTAYGVLTKDADDSIVVASWYGADQDARSESENQKYWCIIRSCIVRLRVLK